MINKTLAIIFTAVAVSAASFAGETLRIAIGTQDTTINCATGGPIVRELKLLEKFLPRTGKYKDVTYDIQWESQPTGAQLNSKFIANQLDIVQMADFPSIVGATAFAAAGNEARSLYIATLSGGINGEGNAILVPINSPAQSLKDLKGKNFSVPFASTAHAMLIRAIQDLGWDPNKDVSIISQTPEVGGSALKSGQIDAHANFVPFGELFPFRGVARKIYDGAASKVTTTHGVQTRSDFAEKHPEVLVAYLRATLEADRLLREDVEGLSEKLSQWTGIEAEIYYAFHGPNGIQTRDFSLKPEYVRAIQRAQESLKVLKKVEKEIDVSKFVDDRFIRQAAKEAGLDYDARLKSYEPIPFSGGAEDTGKPIENAKLAGQIWVKGESKVRNYSSPKAAFNASAKFKAEGKSLRVIFVHDRESGLKLFADKAWYVHVGDDISAFLLKESADKWAADHKGEVVDFAAAGKLAEKGVKTSSL